MQFKVGDRVVISPSSEFCNQCHVVGTVKSTNFDRLYIYYVKFDNGYCNWYDDDDLEYALERDYRFI